MQIHFTMIQTWIDTSLLWMIKINKSLPLSAHSIQKTHHRKNKRMLSRKGQGSPSVARLLC